MDMANASFFVIESASTGFRIDSHGVIGQYRTAQQKKTGRGNIRDISATRLSLRDPIGFPPHPRGWLSIIVYHLCLLQLRVKHNHEKMSTPEEISRPA
jgi:hypothetical protein